MSNNYELNDLFDYKNRYIYQNTDGFKFSLDSILLAEFAKVKKNDKVLDLCTGNAPIPLVLSLKCEGEIIGVELQKEVYEMAVASIKYNGVENQVKIYNDDVKNVPKLFPGKYFDVITCNPPYFKYNKNTKELNKETLKSIARHEITINLDDIFRVVSLTLTDNGSFYMVHRLDRIDEIILNASKYKLYLKELQVVVTNDVDIKLVLLKFKKHANYGIKVNKIVNVDNLSSYQHIFKER